MTLRAILSFPVLLYQSMLLALGQIWANKLRGVLTTLGIMIGVASVTAVVAVISGMKNKVLTEFEAFGTNKMFVAPDRPAGKRFAPWIPFRPEDFDGMLEHCPSVKAFTRMMWIGSNISYMSRTENSVGVMGIEASWHVVEHRDVTVGRPFSLIDNEQGRPVCIINSVLRDKLALNRDPTGQSVLLGQRRFLVVGMIAPSSGLLGRGADQSEAFIPYKSALRLQQRGPFVLAASKTPELSDEARAEITFFLRQKRHIKPGDGPNFRIETAAEFVDRFKSVATYITLAATGIVGISLLVGGVGIMNIMLVSVSERTREIGLRKAVGARPSAILLQFLIEAVMLCVLGGLIGLAVGQALTTVVISYIPSEAGLGLKNVYVPGWAIALALGFSISVGLIFGMFPAIKAARLDPIEALRHE
jgi:putative ABC transport system permease protein